MLNITCKGGDIRQVAEGTTIDALCRDISMGLYRVACAAKLNGKTVDLRTPLTEDGAVDILTFDDEDGKKAYWHTTSHIMAQAVGRLWPGTKLTIGPSIDSGFYYDFDSEHNFSAEDLIAIEAEMKKIIKEALPIERFTLPRDEALTLMKDEPYKCELITELPEGEEISFYRQGDFVDLCAGPHLPDTGRVKAVKLLSATGAYWRGDSKNKMLQRIYGIAFPKTADLQAHLEKLEEAKKRDHNKLGRELELFTTVDVIGQGLPILLPKGARIVQLLQRFVEDEEQKRGYLLTKTPLMAKSDLYKISGHWDHYKEGMFVLGDEEKDDEVFALRPMTCPFQYMIYKSAQRSYRDLPIRYNETSTLFRNESSGEMHGLIRVRQFTLADAHIMCTPEQVESEFRNVLDLVQYMAKCLGIDKDITYRFSKWDPNNKKKYIDMPEAWEQTEAAMKTILDHIGLNYTEEKDEAAFYGPKLDIQFKNVFGKEDTLFTIQIDFALAERFDMVYIDKDNQKKRPFIIHRSSIGCYERTLAMLIEKYAGALPLWIAPEQVRVMTVTEKSNEYAKEQTEKLKRLGIRATVDERQEKIGYKIREARNERIPYMLVVGEKEVEGNSFAIRRRGEGEIGSMSVEDFTAMVLKENAEKVIF